MTPQKAVRHMLYFDLYQTWEVKTSPSAATARMVRTTLKYLAGAIVADDWKALNAIPEQQAMVLLDGALSATSLSSQSRSNYRNYLRRLYRFAEAEGIAIGSGGGHQLWPSVPQGTTLARRDRVTYDRFMRWAIARGIWPAAIKPHDLLDWAKHEKNRGNLHWRKDYERLQIAWRMFADGSMLPALTACPLPAKLSQKYALPVDQWPGNLRDEWQRMTTRAAAPLRKGGMRPWRPVTQGLYEARLALFLGWLVGERTALRLVDQTWSALLCVANCQDYLNWLVGRTGKGYLNPSHTSFLRMARGFHRFLLDSPQDVIQEFTDLCKRCEVEERDKALRMAPFPLVDQGCRAILAAAVDAMRSGQRSKGDARAASLQVDAIVFGLLTTRALRRANLIGLRIGDNLVRVEHGFELRYSAKEMKGHKKFETRVPAELVVIIEDYLARGYKALTGHLPATGDLLLVNRHGKPLTAGTFGQRVRMLTRKYVGKTLHPHLFRHIVATHAAQAWKMTPTELAAFLAHKSVLTVMKYYEVTNPARAAERFDAFRQGSAA